MGNKSYGEVNIAGVTISILDLAKRNNINLFATDKAKLAPAELTPKRLARLFRMQINMWIGTERVTPSFLYTKYGQKHHRAQHIFPGAEYYVTDQNASDLLEVFKAVYEIHKTTFETRIRQILRARKAI